MTDERYNEIINDPDAVLTEEEIAEGWMFCPGCDYLLVKEGDCCMNRGLDSDGEEIMFI